MSNMGYKILAKFCREKELTDAHKEGILLGMHIMGIQSEKWLDNEEHATAYRMDTWDECGFSGWREIYGHTKGFLEAKQPEESGEGMKERLGKYEDCEESDVSDMEITDDKGMTWGQLKGEMKTNLNETVSDENDEFEVVDNEGEGSNGEDEESDWTQYIFENVEYLVGPEADLGRVVLEMDDYQPVGVFEDDKIVFEDNLQVENHFQRVRESTIPEDPDEAIDLITCFIEDNYRDLCLDVYDHPHPHHPTTLRVDRRDNQATRCFRSKSFHFGGCGLPSRVANNNILGKNMGEVMKEIESLL